MKPDVTIPVTEEYVDALVAVEVVEIRPEPVVAQARGVSDGLTLWEDGLGPLPVSIALVGDSGVQLGE